MKGTHWIGLALTMSMGCGNTDEKDSGGSGDDFVDATDDGSSGAGSTDGGSETGGEETGGEETGGEETGGEETGGEETGGGETGGEETGGEETGGEETGGEETGGSEDGPDDLVLPPGLNGNIVDPSVAMVDFSATNMDGSPRSIEDLIDGPTVMWFYPAAATFG